MSDRYTMRRVADPAAGVQRVALLRQGDRKAPAESRASMPDVGEW